MTMQCDFCHRDATTEVWGDHGTELFHVCDFCEEEVLRLESGTHHRPSAQHEHVSGTRSDISVLL
jgi:protein-arginine kinase activator protein McsA